MGFFVNPGCGDVIGEPYYHNGDVHVERVWDTGRYAHATVIGMCKVQPRADGFTPEEWDAVVDAAQSIYEARKGRIADRSAQ